MRLILWFIPFLKSLEDEKFCYTEILRELEDFKLKFSTGEKFQPKFWYEKAVIDG